MEEGISIQKLSNMMKEKTLLLLFDFIFKKESAKKYILKVVYTWNLLYAEHMTCKHVSALIHNKAEIKRYLSN